jgi:hypothetical protein
MSDRLFCNETHDVKKNTPDPSRRAGSFTHAPADVGKGEIKACHKKTPADETASALTDSSITEA